LATELWYTEVPVHAVLDEVTSSLGEVMNWKIGSKIMLDANANSPVEVRCGELPMFRAKMGRRGNSMAVRIDDKITKQPQ
jgi:flagellar motor switch protein FliM